MDKFSVKQVLIGSAILISIIFSYDWVFGDHNYSDCILNHIKDAKSERSANIIRDACINNFPGPKWDELSTTPPK